MRPTCCGKVCTPYRKEYGRDSWEEGFRCKRCDRIRVPHITELDPSYENSREAIRLAGIEFDATFTVSPPITRFRGEYRWLSNFHLGSIWYRDHAYPSVEHAYQAAKAVTESERQMIAHAASPGEAKLLGGTTPKRPDWEAVKVGIMTKLVTIKFTESEELRQKLLATGNARLVEGNNHGDTFWGVCGGIGENMLGRIIMAVRKQIIRNRREM